MASDARISTALPSHPKTKKLIRRLGAGGAWHLICLFLWSASNRSDGDLSGMTGEDIELAVDWQGEQGALVRVLVELAFLDGDEGEYLIHDWAEHNPWAAGSEKRSEKSKWAALCKRYGRTEAARMMPGYAADLPVAPAPAPAAPKGDASGTPDALPESASGTPLANSGSAPSPSPIPLPSPLPSPLPNPDTPLPPKGGVRRSRIDPDEEPGGFAAWYALYRRKDAKRDAIKAWRQLGPDEVLQARMMSALVSWKWNEDRTKNPLPASWIRGGRWEDESVRKAPASGSGPLPPWVLEAGFQHIAEAQNAGCHIGNYRDFRDGQRMETIPA